jgi:transposase-like protein
MKNFVVAFFSIYFIEHKSFVLKKEIYKEKLELKEVSLGDDVPFSKIHCPSCAEQVTSDNLDLGKAVAKCGSCHVVFPIEDTLTLVSTQKTKEEKTALIPEGVEVFEYGDQLEISVNNHFNWVDGVLSMFAIIIPIVSLISILTAINNSAFGIILLVTIINAFLVGFPIYWYLVGRKRNKIYFNINKNTLDIERRPKYMIKDKSFSKDSIEQVYIKPGYGLYAIINEYGEQKHVELLRSFNPVLMKFLEKTIEKNLGIENIDY